MSLYSNYCVDVYKRQVVDIYDKQTKDLLLYAEVPLSIGFDKIQQNIGSCLLYTSCDRLPFSKLNSPWVSVPMSTRSSLI